jgi:kynureninase
MKFKNTLQFARKMDREDPLRSYRNKFLIPKINNKQSIYLIGNSLGLQPKITKQFINQELEDWAKLGGEGHVHARNPWLYHHKLPKKTLAALIGAKPSEVVAMNQLTINLHLMMVSFYTPTTERYKIIAEAGAFSSDQYAFESQIKFHGLNPDKVLIELKPREEEFTLRTEDILRTIAEHGREVALVILGGVQYYTGQLFDIPRITEAGHSVGAIAGFDLAHAVGNIPLNLHKDEVDFAVWCSYKYLNAGPGAIAGAYLHEKYENNIELPRFTGWWGYNESERFNMQKGFKPMKGVDGWQLSNVPIFQNAALLASLAIFQEAGIKALRKKSIALTAYMEYILKEIDPLENTLKIITPNNPEERGCQLSVFMKQDGKKTFQQLNKAGVIADWRDPNVIRVAPVPLYNTFEEVYKVGEIIGSLIK